MLNALRQRFRVWLFRPKIEHVAITLTQRRIFIIPTKQGFTLGFVLVLMLHRLQAVGEFSKQNSDAMVRELIEAVTIP